MTRYIVKFASQYEKSLPIQNNLVRYLLKSRNAPSTTTYYCNTGLQASFRFKIWNIIHIKLNFYGPFLNIFKKSDKKIQSRWKIETLLKKKLESVKAEKIISTIYEIFFPWRILLKFPKFSRIILFSPQFCRYPQPVFFLQK